jgi:hypothetical protein
VDFHIVIRNWLLVQSSDVQKSLQPLIDMILAMSCVSHVVS